MELPSTIPGRRSPWTAAGALAGLLLISSTTIWAQVSAEQLVAAGKLEEAIRIYKDLAKADPANPNLLLNLSITEYKSKHYHEAATHAAAALKLQPDLLPAQLFLGASHLELGEFARAIQPLEQVIAANPRERNARLMLGEALLEDGKPEKAIPHLTA
ncbi:MAG: tetratricopeptide repeat protein, partial [Bryobacteraceae bacterium]